jgi:hypothetical protein
MAAALAHVLPDGVVFFVYDLGGWGGYYVGFFTSADSLERELAEFKVKHGVDCVVRGGTVSTLERFTRDNFPDVVFDIDSWSASARDLATAKEAGLACRTSAAHVRGQRCLWFPEAQTPERGRRGQ